jgi:hypothetical protein
MAREHLSDQEFLIATYKKLGGLLLTVPFAGPDGQGRNDAHYLTIDTVTLSDYFTYSHSNPEYAAREEWGRKAAIRAGQAVISAEVAGGPTINIFRPASLLIKGLFPEVLAIQGMDPTEQGFILSDVRGPVRDPQNHPAISYLDRLPEPDPGNIPQF